MKEWMNKWMNEWKRAGIHQFNRTSVPPSASPSVRPSRGGKKEEGKWEWKENYRWRFSVFLAFSAFGFKIRLHFLGALAPLDQNCGTLILSSSFSIFSFPLPIFLLVRRNNRCLSVVFRHVCCSSVVCQQSACRLSTDCPLSFCCFSSCLPFICCLITVCLLSDYCLSAVWRPVSGSGCFLSACISGIPISASVFLGYRCDGNLYIATGLTEAVGWWQLQLYHKRLSNAKGYSYFYRSHFPSQYQYQRCQSNN